MYDHFDFEIPKTSIAANERNPARPLYTYEWDTQELPDIPEYRDEMLVDEKRLSFLRKYYGMIKLIDDNVGKVMDFLTDNDLNDNTIVVFAADHGELGECTILTKDIKMVWWHVIFIDSLSQRIQPYVYY